MDWWQALVNCNKPSYPTKNGECDQVRDYHQLIKHTATLSLFSSKYNPSNETKKCGLSKELLGQDRTEYTSHHRKGG
jgi:hypothetical protein